MKLRTAPFQAVKLEQKRVELRLFDEKRRRLKVGDKICFVEMQSGESLQVEILDLKKFSDFFELYKHFTPKEMGYIEGEDANAEDMYAYYSKEDIEKYGVLAICIKQI